MNDHVNDAVTKLAEDGAAAEMARHAAEQARRLAEDARVDREHHRDARDAVREEYERLRNSEDPTLMCLCGVVAEGRHILRKRALVSRFDHQALCGHSQSSTLLLRPQRLRARDLTPQDSANGM
jgi:hypothetical protein